MGVRVGVGDGVGLDGADVSEGVTKGVGRGDDAGFAFSTGSTSAATRALMGVNSGARPGAGAAAVGRPGIRTAEQETNRRPSSAREKT
jgi:hypothetical protein